MKTSFIFKIAALLLGMSLPVQAADSLSMSVGYYDMGRMGNDRQDKAMSLVAEWRPEIRWADGLVAPFAGGMLTTDRGLYGYAGVGLDFHPGENFYVFPNLAAGLYANGDGKDLGHEVEFRTGVEMGVDLSEGRRIGLAIHHISNAGLGDKNPGTEILSLTYSLPLGN
ncbi:MAG: hypothetical protein A2018_00810 [Alphaproteobacteria bacterium GWF2_58_20]|nr:MAG: hypothetical protein A2018_00810 [Alphaproteobacteria bacterium GWF2_58_20]